MDIAVDLSGARIETPRVIMRAFRPDDLYDFYCYAKVEGVGEAAGWSHHKTLEESERILNKFCGKRNILALEFKENGKMIGSIGLHYSWANDMEKYSAFRVKEIGYVLSKDYWGRGIMTETARIFNERCLEDLRLDALTATCFSGNPGSKRVIEKCGFQFVSQGEHYAKHLGRTLPAEKFILFKNERTCGV